MIGETCTEFIMFGPNSKVVNEVFDDSEVPGVVCHVSYQTTHSPRMPGVPIGKPEENNGAGNRQVRHFE
jgi:catabolite regulation protein CreA